MKVPRHQLALDLALMDGARHGIAKVMRDVRGAWAVDHQRQAVFAPVDANDPDELPSTTEEPYRLHQSERTTHAGSIGTLGTWLSLGTNLHV